MDYFTKFYASEIADIKLALHFVDKASGYPPDIMKETYYTLGLKVGRFNQLGGYERYRSSWNVSQNVVIVHKWQSGTNADEKVGWCAKYIITPTEVKPYSDEDE